LAVNFIVSSSPFLLAFSQKMKAFSEFWDVFQKGGDESVKTISFIVQGDEPETPKIPCFLGITETNSTEIRFSGMTDWQAWQ